MRVQLLNQRISPLGEHSFLLPSNAKRLMNGTWAEHVDHDQTTQHAASNQGLHYLHIDK